MEDEKYSKLIYIFHNSKLFNIYFAFLSHEKIVSIKVKSFLLDYLCNEWYLFNVQSDSNFCFAHSCKKTQAMRSKYLWRLNWLNFFLKLQQSKSKYASYLLASDAYDYLFSDQKLIIFRKFLLNTILSEQFSEYLIHFEFDTLFGTRE